MPLVTEEAGDEPTANGCSPPPMSRTTPPDGCVAATVVGVVVVVVEVDVVVVVVVVDGATVVGVVVVEVEVDVVVVVGGAVAASLARWSRRPTPKPVGVPSYDATSAGPAPQLAVFQLQPR